MRYLLDTCVLSDFVKEEPGTQTQLRQTSPTDIAVSSITVMELRYGLQLNPQRAAKIEPIITSLLASVTLLPFSTAEAEQAARLRSLLKMTGQPIGAYDVLIAATALQHSLIMVTANVREFARIPGLQVVPPNSTLQLTHPIAETLNLSRVLHCSLFIVHCSLI